MRLPRDVSGDDLIRALARLGYTVTRQAGSHARLTVATKRGQHHVTIPRHDALRVGTLSAILADVADWLQISKDELARNLFGNP